MAGGATIAVGTFGEIIVGHGGAIRPATPGQRTLLLGVAGSAAGFVAVGADGTILRGGPHGLASVESGVAGLLTSVAMSGEDVYVVGAGGTILHGPLDGPLARQASGSERFLSGVASPAAGRAVAVGKGGIILTTQDQGATWTEAQAGTSDLTCVFAEGSVAIAVGAGGTVLRSDGTPFAAVASGTTEDLLAAGGRGAEVWAVGRGGTALRSTDGGTTFAPVDSGVKVDLLGVAVDEAGTTIVGDRGTILVGAGGKLAPVASGTTNALTHVWKNIIVGAGGTVLARQQ
jgi:photosystem II stability/assembly factor-like uncharacterized protein